MSDSDITTHLMECILAKHLAYQSKIFVKLNISNRSLSIRYCQATGFLTTVLQRSQTIVNRRRHIISIQVIDSEDTTLFFNLCHLFSSSVLSFILMIKSNLRNASHFVDFAYRQINLQPRTYRYASTLTYLTVNLPGSEQKL